MWMRESKMTHVNNLTYINLINKVLVPNSLKVEHIQINCISSREKK